MLKLKSKLKKGKFMNKVLMTCFLGAVLLQANNIITKELAEKQGEGFALTVNMNPTASYEEKLKLCEDLVNSGGLLGVDNRKEMLPFVVKGCKENIK